MKSVFVRFVREEVGQDMIEYAIMTGIIAVAAITAITAISGKVTNVFSTLDSTLPAGS